MKVVGPLRTMRYKSKYRERSGRLIPPRWINVDSDKVMYDSYWIQESYAEQKEFIENPEWKEYINLKKERQEDYEKLKKLYGRKATAYEYVYFIRVVGESVFKVGISSWPPSRLSSLRTDNHCELEFDMIIDCERSIDENYFPSKDLEKKFHKFLEKWHRKGEWFQIPDSVEPNEYYEKIVEVLDGIKTGGLNIYYENNKIDRIYDLFSKEDNIDNKHSFFGSWKLIDYYC